MRTRYAATILILLALIIPLATAQETIQIDKTFTQETTILLDTQNISGLTITGNHTGNTSEVYLVTNQSRKRVVGLYGTIAFEDVCTQTCEFGNETAEYLEIEVDGELYIERIELRTSTEEEDASQASISSSEIQTQELIGIQDISDAWYNNNWSYREKITINSSKVDETLTDFPVYIDLSDLSTNFHTNANSDAGDIRITTTDGTTELAREIVTYNATSDTGEIHFKANTISNTTDTDFYIYYANSAASNYENNATYGRNNVWTNGHIGGYHLHQNPTDAAPQITDFTTTQNDGTTNGSMTASDTITGQIGKAIEFDGADDSIITNSSTEYIITDQAFSILAWVKSNGVTNQFDNIVTLRSNATYPFEVGFGEDGSGFDGIYIGATADFIEGDTNTEPPAVGEWHQVVVTYNGNGPGSLSNYAIYLNTVEQTLNTALNFGNTIQQTTIANNGNDEHFNGTIDEIRIYNRNISISEITASFANQNDTTTFYSVSEFEDVGPIFGEQQAGNWADTRWAHRETITINSSQVDANLADFPVYVNLADLTNTFHNNTRSDAGDIRITDTNLTELPREVVYYNQTNSTGEIHFKANLSNTTNNEYHIYYGSSLAVDYVDTATYGAHNVWTNSHEGVWHLQEDPSGTEPQITNSVLNQINGISNGSMISNDSVQGQVQQGIDFDGTDDFILLGDGTDLNMGDGAGTDTPLTISGWVNVSNPGKAHIFTKADGDPTTWEYFLRIEDGSVRTRFYSGGGGNTMYQDSNFENNNEWTYVTATYNGNETPAGISMFVNGQEIPANNTYINSYDGVEVNGSTSRIGAFASDNPTYEQYTDGNIDEVRVSTVVRSTAWILAEFHNQNDTTSFYSVSTAEQNLNPDSFLTTWKTDNPGTSTSNSISLPLESDGNYNFIIDWGDGNMSTITAWNQVETTHSYASTGTYDVSITGTLDGWRFNNGGDAQKLLDVRQWGNISLGNNSGYFYGASNLQVTATDTPNLIQTTDLSNTFRGTNLTIANGFENWNVSGVNIFNDMFRDSTGFNANISGWNTSSMTSIGAMFLNADNFNQDLDQWDVSGVGGMYAVFFAADVFNGNISTWDVSNVAAFDQTFQGSIFDGDISQWNMSSATRIDSMFRVNRDFTGNISGWDTSKITNMGSTFYDTSFNGDISEWDVSKVTSFDQFLYKTGVFNQDIGNWDVSNATNMRRMFSGTHAFDQDISEWNISKVTDMTEFFDRGSGLSKRNTDFMLRNWANLNLQNNTPLHLGSSVYTILGNVSRQQIIDNYNWTITGGTLSSLPADYTFDGESTNFSAVSNINSTQAILENTTYGKIAWNNNINASYQYYDRDILFGQDWVFVNSTNLHSSHNSSANITIYGNYENPVVRRDGTLCTETTNPVCEILNTNATQVTFNVTSFSNYSIENNTPPTHNTPVLNSSSATTLPSNDITVYAQNLNDAENDTINLNFDWRIDDTSIAVLNTPFNINISSNATGAVQDYTTNQNNGTLGDGNVSLLPSWVSQGVIGGAYEFINGEYIRYPINQQNDFTINTWVKTTNTGQDEYTGIIASADDGADPNSFQMDIGGSGQGCTSQYRFYYDGTGAADTLCMGSITTNWTLLSVTYDGTTLITYYNGQQTNATTESGWNTNISTLKVGINRASNAPFEGTIDEVSLYDKALSSQQIQQLYEEGNESLNNNPTNTSTIVSEETRTGENWSVSVTPSDQYNSGITRTSNSLLIESLGVNINFTAPTPANDTSTNTTPVRINTSIFAPSLQDITYNWDGANYTLYNDSLIVLLGLNNNTELGENITNLVDSSSTGYSVTTVGDPTFTAGEYGQAIKLDGVDDYIELGDTGIGVSTPRTIAGWVYPSDTTQNSYEVAFGFEDGGNQDELQISTDGGGDCSGNGIILQTDDFSTCLIDTMQNKWYHIAATFDGTTVTGYVDGTERTSNTQSSAITPFFEIGRDESAGAYFNGSVDEVHVYDRALSGEEIEALYASNIVQINNTDWNFYTEQQLSDAGNYTYYVHVEDGAGATDQTETRTIEFIPPDIFTNSSFVTVWKTDNPGTSNDTTISLPLEGSGTYNFTVDWGDGSQDVITSDSASHTYQTAGTYTVTITGTINGWRFNNGGDAQKLLDIQQWGDLRLGNNDGYFWGASNLIITANDTLTLGDTTNLLRAFRNTNLSTAPSLQYLDTSNVTSMGGMFKDSIRFNENISGWNTSSMTSFGSMFNNANYFNQDLDQWDTSQITSMGSVFFGADRFNGNVSTWNTSQVTSMDNLFWGSNFSGDVSQWDVGNVRFFGQMFRFAGDFNSDLSGWNTSSGEDMTDMFRGKDSFTSDLSGWDVSQVTSMNRMFAGADSFESDLSGWDVSQVTDMGNMFSSGAGLSVANYDKLLQSWSELTLESTVIFNAGNSQYSVAGIAGRAEMTNTYNWDINDNGLINIPLYETFNGTTTDYATEANITNVSGAVLEKTRYGKITWNQPIDASSQDFDSHVTMGENWIDVDITNLRESLNNSANITIQGNYVYPDIRLDGVLCDADTTPSCTIIQQNSSQVTFSVEEMGNYSVENSTQEIFVSSWKTDNPGTSSNNQVELPLLSSGNYNFVVEWGDSTQDTITVWDQAQTTHTYGSAGEYNITITGTLEGWQFDGGDEKKILDITRWGALRITDTGSNFLNASNLVISAQDTLNLSQINNLSSAFENTNLSQANSLENLPTQNVTTMRRMLKNTSINQDLGAWNISSVIDFREFLENSELEVANYDKLLQGWPTSPPQSDQNFSAGASQYSVAGVAGRQELTDTYNWTITDGGLINLPLYETFNGTTTNFSAVSNLSSVSGAILEKTRYGKITWNQPIDASSQDFDSHVTMGENWIDVDITNLRESLNNSANITIKGTYVNPIIRKNGIVCADCVVLVANSSEVTFNVSQMSNYSVSDGVGVAFTQPTPASGTITQSTNFTLNSTINASEVQEIIFTWDEENTSIYDDRIQALYNFNNNSALGENETFVYDASTNNIHGTKTGATHEPGVYGQAISFTGTNELDLDQEIRLDGDFTIAYHFNTARSSSWRLLKNEVTYNYAIWHRSANEISLGGNDITLTESFATNEWEHIIIRREGSNIRVYRNGNLVATDTWSGQLRIDQIGGKTQDTSWDEYEGLADDVIIYDVALPEQETIQLATASMQQQSLTNYEYTRVQNILAEGTYDYTVYAQDNAGITDQATRNITLNSVPVLQEARITPTTKTLTTQPLNGYCSATRVGDKNLTYNYRWYRDGVQYANGSSSPHLPGKEILVDTRGSTNTSSGEAWILGCQVSDGVETSNWTNSTEVQIETGTSISTCTELQNIDNNLSANYELTQDIDCSETYTWNSGDGFQTTGSLQGILQGNGYTIQSPYINRPSESDIALFNVATNGIIRNIRVESAHIRADNDVAILALTNQGLIEDCVVSGTVKGRIERSGGIVAQNDGNITRCASHTEITQVTPGTYSWSGGIAGRNDGEITHCYSTQQVRANENNPGGIVGENQGLIEQCYSTSEVFGGPTDPQPIAFNTGDGVLDTFYDIDKVRYDDNNGIPITTQQFSNQSTFVTTTGLINPWDINDYRTPETLTRSYWNLTETYPELLTITNQPTVPRAPTYTRIREDAVDITWEPAQENVTYTVQRAADNSQAPDTFSNLTTTNNTQYTDTGLSANTTYWYRILTNNGETTSPSDVTTATTISTCGQLANISMESNYALNQDIDCSETYNWNSGQGWLGIGGSDFDSGFRGSLYGNNHAITGLYINTSDSYRGLFRYLTFSAQVQNITLDAVNIETSALTGGIAAHNAGLIEYCSVNGRARITGDGLGGVTGYNLNTISKCSVDMDIFSPDIRVGGITGYNNWNVDNCYTKGQVFAEGRAAGVVGSARDSSKVDSCYTIALLDFTYGSAGIVGHQPVLVDNSFVDEEVTSSSGQGGGTFKTTEQMKNKDTYTDTATPGLDEAWDFTNNTNNDTKNQDIWNINNHTNNGYPHFAQFNDTRTTAGPPTYQEITSSSVQVHWIPIEQTTNYTIQRAPQNGSLIGTFSTIATTNESSYRDTGLSTNTTYWYRITTNATQKTTSPTNVRTSQLISTCQELQDIQRYENYELSQNIDCSNSILWNAGEGFQPTGDDWENAYMGSLHGAGYTIGSLYMNRPTENRQAPFLVGYFGEIHNITLEQVTVTGSTTIGGLASYNYGRIYNCIASGTVQGVGNAGGILANNEDTGEISRCISYMTVETTGRGAGGLVGYNRGEMRNCAAIANVTNTDTGVGEAGGLVATNRDLIDSCYSASTLSLAGSRTGGLVGYYSDSGNPRTLNSFFDEDVAGRSDGPGEPKSTAEMRNKSTYTATATVGLDEAWDFTNNTNNDTKNQDIWNINSQINDGYPYLATAAPEFVIAKTPTFRDIFDTRITVNWQLVEDADNYTLERAPTVNNTAGNFSTVTTINATTYTDVGLTSNTTYWYRVTAGVFNTTSIPSPSSRVKSAALITTCDQLQAINLTLNYQLDAHIDCSATNTWNSGEGFVPLGSNVADAFTGSLQGEGYEIRGLAINRPLQSAQALMFVGEGGYVNNITVRADVEGGLYSAILASQNYGEIQNCVVLGQAKANGQYAGGITGRNRQTIRNCASYADIRSTSSYAGGITGRNEGEISSTQARGEVIADTQYAGGITGRNEGEINSSYSTGVVQTITDAGGLIGLEEGNTSNSFWDTQTSGQSTSAGGEGKTTSQLQTASTYTNTATVGLNESWSLSEQSSYTNEQWYLLTNDYPRLQHEYFVEQISVDPTSIVAEEDVQGYCSVIANAQTITTEYEWLQNSVLQSNGTQNISTNTVTNIANTTVTNTSIGDEWTLRCRADDTQRTTAYQEATSTVVGPQLDISFVAPTVTDNFETIFNQTVTSTTDIETFALENVTHHFGDQNTSVYSNEMLLMYNFDNLAALDEDSFTAHDASANELHATLNNASYTTGKYGQALSLNGIDTYAQANDTVLDPQTNSFTISLWAYIDDTEGFLISKGNGVSSNDGWSVFYEEIGDNVLVARLGAGSEEANVEYIDPPKNEWIHITMVIDRDNDELKAYLNANASGWIPGGDGVNLTNFTSITSNEPLLIGAREDFNTNYYLNGAIDEVRIYQRTLPPDEVHSKYLSNLRRINDTYWQLQANNTFSDYNSYALYTQATNTLGAGVENQTATRTITFRQRNGPVGNAQNWSWSGISNNVTRVGDAQNWSWQTIQEGEQGIDGQPTDWEWI